MQSEQCSPKQSTENRRRVQRMVVQPRGSLRQASQPLIEPDFEIGCFALFTFQNTIRNIITDHTKLFGSVVSFRGCNLFPKRHQFLLMFQTYSHMLNQPVRAVRHCAMWCEFGTIDVFKKAIWAPPDNRVLIVTEN